MAILRMICLAFVVGCMLTSCDKDDDGNEPLPGELRFSGYSERHVLFYVGGEPRDHENLDLSKLFNQTRLSWISTERYIGDYYYFTGDSLEVGIGTPPYDRLGYFFRNDTLFTYRYSLWFETPTPGYEATGNETELNQKHCLTYTRMYRPDGTVQKGSSFNVSAYETLESLIGMYGYSGIDNMGPNDTLLLINQTKVYK